MTDQIDYTRLKTLMRRAAGGEELTLAFFGGSITQGARASSPEKCYAYHVFEWFEKTFPGAKFHYVNGGIGGTTSHFGVSRVEEDCLMYQPDFVVVDFSVNDDPTDFFEETYEGVIRKALAWPSHPAVVLLNNVYYDTGINAEKQHNAIAEHYALPHVSIKDSIYQRLKNGEFVRSDISPDGLHPNDIGHAMVADEITRLLDHVNRQAREQAAELSGNEGSVRREEPESIRQSVLPAPLTMNSYEHAERLTIREISPELSGFYPDPGEKSGHLDFFKNGWIGRKAGDSIRFEVSGSCVAIQYRKTIRRPALRAAAVLDKDTAHPVLLDGNFDEEWGDCLYLQNLLIHGENQRHTVEVTVLPETGDEAEMTPFYLMSLIVA